MRSNLDNLFDFFIELYGPLFVSRYGEQDSGMWMMALKDVGLDDIEHGLDKIMCGETDFDRYPPNPVEFRKVCLKKEPRQLPYFDKNKALPAPANRDVALNALSEIKRKLGMRIDDE